MATKKFYAVRRGRNLGVFSSWEECETSVKGYSGASFKGFSTEKEAKSWLESSSEATEDTNPEVKDYDAEISKLIQNGFVVAFSDGSFDKSKNKYSYGVILIDKEHKEHEICGTGENLKYIDTQNIAGEVFGAINAMDWALSNGYEKIKIYHDYIGLGSWINDGWKTNSSISKDFVKIFNSKYKGILDVVFEHIKGHSGNKYNDRADALASFAINGCRRVPIAGDNWYTVPNFQIKELEYVFDSLKDEFPSISINKCNDDELKIAYKLALDKNILRTTLFKNSFSKLLVQGAQSVLFQVFTTHVSRFVDENTIYEIAKSSYRTSIDKKIIKKDIDALRLRFPDGYPESIKIQFKQSIINLRYYNDCVNYAQYVYPALLMLEGHIKYLLSKNGIIIDKIFNCFIKNSATGSYVFSQDVLNEHPFTDSDLKNRIEKYYSYYHKNRHTLFHFGDITGNGTDTTRILNTKEEADEIIKDCIEFCRE